MSTHPVIRYYNSRMMPVPRPTMRGPRPYIDAVIPPTNRAGDPAHLLTFFCLRCDRPFETPVIRACCADCSPVLDTAINSLYAQGVNNGR